MEMTLAQDAPAAPLTPKERRERNRREMVDAILVAARAVMQEHGVGALNLTEVARRVHLRPQSLSEYFPSKAAVYDELYERALALFRAGDERAYADHPPGWNQIAAWFTNRVTLADANPDLYHLVFDAPAPDYVPAERVIEASRPLRDGARRMVREAIATGAVAPGMPVERATDLLLSVRRGLVAERLGKRQFVDPESERFEGLVPDVIQLFQASWMGSNAPDERRRAMTD
jgi:AcrR family transcriptional regulator